MPDHLHLLNVQHYQMVRFDLVLDLIENRDEVDVALHIETLFEAKVDHSYMFCLFLFFDEFSKRHFLGILIEIIFLVCKIELILIENRNILLHFDKGLMVVDSHFFDFLNRIPDCKIRMFNIQLFLLVYHGKKESIIVFVPHVHLEMQRF